MTVPSIPSEDELSSLSIKEATYKLPTSNVPEPEPDVLERAKVLASQIKSGVPISSLEVNGVNQSVSGSAKAINSITKHDKLMFMAHVLRDDPFIKEYSLFNGKLVFTFKIIDREIKDIIHKAVASEPDRMMTYILAASIDSISIDGVITKYDIRPVCCSSVSDSLIKNLDDLLDPLSTTVLSLLQSKFKEFRILIDTLIRRAEDKDFWPTP
jgi:hypothetical protein